MSTKRRLLVFAALNVIEGAVVFAIPFLVPSREEAVNWFVWGAGGLMLLSGPLLALAGRWGRRIAAAACLLFWLMGLVGVCAIAASASYLSGIYGHHGTSAAAIATVIAVLVMVLFWLLPAHELHFLRGARGDFE